MNQETATAWATVNLTALRHNTRRLAEKARPAGLMGVVKADAYGHGVVPVARTLVSEGVEWLAVATVAEGVKLRENGLECPILVMGAMHPSWATWYVDFNLDATVASHNVAESLRSVDVPQRGLRIHLKVDTGMGRLGVNPAEVLDTVRMLEATRGIDLVGFYTHLAAADADDLTSAREQISRFDRSLDLVDLGPRLVHIANTEAIRRLPESLRQYPRSLARAGVGLYGSPVREDTREELGLRQVMTLSASVTQVKSVVAGTPISYGGRWVARKDTVIATLGIGYADGYRRILEGKAWVGIDGVRCEVAGTICMDMIMVEVRPESSSVALGSRAVLFGEGGPHVSEVAHWAQTIPYEIWTGIGARVPRVHVEEDPFSL
ncbi:MAG TPA: alanine racemase [Rhodothermia bacterium]